MLTCLQTDGATYLLRRMQTVIVGHQRVAYEQTAAVVGVGTEGVDAVGWCRDIASVDEGEVLLPARDESEVSQSACADRGQSPS